MREKMVTKKNSFVKAAALLAAVVMTVFIGISAMAAGTASRYDPISGTTMKFTKYLVVRKGETNPAVTFEFEVSVPETEVADTATTLGVIPGPDKANVVVGSASFTAGEANTAANDESDGVDRTNGAVAAFVESGGYTYATKDVNIDFTAVSFEEPGVYRYYITEKANADSAFGIDPVSVRTVDVYIIEDPDNAGKLKIGAYIMYKGKVTAAPNMNATAAETAKPNGAEPEGAVKTDKFTNTYPTNRLTLKKTVKGNQGSRDKYFKFNVKVESDAIVDTAHYAVSGLDNPETINKATVYTAADFENNKPNNGEGYLTGRQLKDGYDIYLQHGDAVEIYGIPVGSAYTITETSENYKPSWTIVRDADTSTNIASGSDEIAKETGNTIFTDNTTVTFTNEKSGVIPTGIIASVAGLLVAGVIAGIGFLFFGTRSKRRYEDE